MFPCITNVLKQSARAVRQHARVRQGLLLPRRLADEPRQEVRGLVEKRAPFQTDRKAILCTRGGKINAWGGCNWYFLQKPFDGLKQSLLGSFPLRMLNVKRPSKSMQQRCLRDHFYGRGIAGGIIIQNCL